MTYLKYSLFFCLVLILTACGSATTPETNQFVPINSNNQDQVAPDQTSPEQAQNNVPPESVPMDNGEPIAQVNGQPVSKAEYLRRVQQFQEADATSGFNYEGEQAQLRLSQIQEQVLSGLIDQIIIEQAAAGMGLQVSEEALNNAIAEMQAGQSQDEFNNWLALNNLSYNDFRATLRSQLLANTLFEQIALNVPQSAEQVHVRQILLRDLGQAQNTLARLQTGEDFIILAQTLSEDEASRDSGGDLGWFPRGMQLVPPQLEEAAFRLNPGEVSPVIETVLGYHIIRIEGKEANRALSGQHIQILQGKLFNNWLSQQRASAQIEVFENIAIQ